MACSQYYSDNVISFCLWLLTQKNEANQFLYSFKSQEDPKINYEATLKLLKAYKDLLNPLEAVWISLEKDEYCFEMINYIYIDKERFYNTYFKGIQ